MAKAKKLDLPKYLRVRAARAHDEHLALDERVYTESAELIEDFREQLATARKDALRRAVQKLNSIQPPPHSRGLDSVIYDLKREADECDADLRSMAEKEKSDEA
ncbi:hypothetical protein LCGC14_0234860 [marine sediment metagenome]|uniref:Uncharacterized protein n=1 Tax=marine sediment metagenome TaxID=412755 RepID=A0A0F9U8T9_9ZZZZ